MSTAAALTELLFKYLASRQIEDVKRLIQKHGRELEGVPADDPSAPRLFYILSVVSEYSPTAANIASRLAAAYSGPWPPQLPVSICVLIKAGEAALALYQNRHSDVDIACQWVESNAERFGATTELRATVALITARSQKARALYGQALSPARSAGELYSQAGLPKMAAVAKATESWILQQLGDLQGSVEVAAAASAVLQDTKDWTIKGNLKFSEVRRKARVGSDDDSVRAGYVEVANLYSQCTPPHRNMIRILLRLADHELRMSSKPQNSARRNELLESAASNIARAEELLKGDSADGRNRCRLYLAKANKALFDLHPGLVLARRLSKEAFELSKADHDELMMARSCMQRAKVEHWGADRAERGEMTLDLEGNIVSMRSAALEYITRAIELATPLDHKRLRATCHACRGELYLRSPFHNVPAARREYDAAVQCMAHREDLDHLFERIQALGKKLDSTVFGAGKMIFCVTASNALGGQSLKSTVEALERKVILAAHSQLGDNDRAISQTLGISLNKVSGVLSCRPAQEREKFEACNPCDPVIFVVTDAIALSQPLSCTVEAMKRAIVGAANIRYERDEHSVRDLLHIGHGTHVRYSPQPRTLA